ncbi:DUF6197 family protein [Bailinhaonella thermotolerans]|uniref:Uncharacterized protein n=1 Tax=Bailinhaonella thermotolerans TaxID=1070861 RepID=A0A3A4A5Y0_9ACTN|nr:hypothetical protein [Bailinhaonella thermotolerans]RJL21063.1 hypothetical protein D5H75_38260 [Bailinhaonella thermotolerans]
MTAPEPTESTESTEPAAPDVLDRARTLIATNGLYKGPFVDRDQHRADGRPWRACALCPAGAIALVCGLDPWDWVHLGPPDPAQRAAATALLLLLEHLQRRGQIPVVETHPLRLVGEWTDAPQRTATDVLIELRLAAEYGREQPVPDPDDLERPAPPQSDPTEE